LLANYNSWVGYEPAALFYDRFNAHNICSLSHRSSPNPNALVSKILIRGYNALNSKTITNPSPACSRYSFTFSPILASAATKRHYSRFLLRHFAPMSPLQPTSASPSLGFTRFGLDWFNGGAIHPPVFRAGAIVLLGHLIFICEVCSPDTLISSRSSKFLLQYAKKCEKSSNCKDCTA